MAGGDLNIRGVVGFNSPGVEAAKIGRIDANSTKGGDGTVFDMKVEKDAGWLSQWFWGTKERPDTIGKP
jgi:hypothetical protein